jgi:hypothetical protein
MSTWIRRRFGRFERKPPQDSEEAGPVGLLTARERAVAGVVGLAALGFAAYATFRSDMEGPVTALAAVGGLLLLLAFVGHRIVELRYRDYGVRFLAGGLEKLDQGDRVGGRRDVETAVALDPNLKGVARRVLSKLDYEEAVLAAVETMRPAGFKRTDIGVDAIVEVDGAKIGVEVKAGPSVRIRPLAWYMASDGGVDAVLFVIRRDVAKPDQLELDRLESESNAAVTYWDADDPASLLHNAIERLATAVRRRS